jgi:hypothetical protein
VSRERFLRISDKVIEWCFYAIVFAAPFSKSISEVAIVLAITLWVLRKLVTGPMRIVPTELNLPFLIFVASMLPSFINTVSPALSVRALFTKVLKFVALYFVMVEMIDSRAKLKRISIVAFASMVLIFFDGFIQYHFTYVDLLHNYPSWKFRPPVDRFFKGFPTASFPYPNDFSAWMLLTLIPLACAALFGLKKGAMRYGAGAVALGLFYLFFLAKARGAWIGLGISTVYIALSKKKIWLIAFLALLITIPFVFKMEMARDIFALTSVGDRSFMWGTGWEIFQRHPVIGNGLNTFFEHFKQYRTDQFKGKKGSYAHNCYLQMAADVGLLGLAGFLWLMVSYFRDVRQKLQKIRDALYGSLLWGISIGVFAFLVHSFFDTNLYSLNLATLFWYSIGMSESIMRVAGGHS